MKISLTISASAPMIAQILAYLENNGDDAEVSAEPVTLPTAGHLVTATPTLAPADAHPVTASPEPAELDASGLPWDERIHAGTKTKKADNTWTKRRGVSDLEYKTVEAELRARVGNGAGAAIAPAAEPVQPVPAPTVSTAAVAAPVPSEPLPVTLPTPLPVAEPVPPAPMPVPAPAPVPPAPMPVPAPAPAAVAPTNLHELLTALGPLMDPSQGGSITPEYLTGIVHEVNTAWAGHLNGGTINSIGDIAAYPALSIASYIWQLFQRDGKVA